MQKGPLKWVQYTPGILEQYSLDRISLDVKHAFATNSLQ